MDTKTNKNLSMIDIVPLRPYIDRLSESKSIGVQNLCNNYKAKLDAGMLDSQLCEQFVIELSVVAETEDEKMVLKEVNEAVKENDTNLRMARSVSQLPTSSCVFVAPMIESAVVDYMVNKNNETRESLRNSVSLFENEQIVKDILEAVHYEQYEENSGKKLVNASLKENFKEAPAKTYTEEEVDKILNARIAEMKEDKPVVKKSFSEVPHKIKLAESISNIMRKCKNENVRVICEQYISALNQGKPEEMLYETFISAVSPYNYLSAVDTEVSAIDNRVSKYKQEIDLRKILEMMRQTGSYYIVPLIEELVVDHMEHKSMATRAVLVQRLNAFEYDPFVRDILMLVQKDESLPNTVNLGESVEYLSAKVKPEPVFSPVQYVKENECVFNVRGSYFARKGSNISKLTKSEIENLSESFKGLCAIVNSDNVNISKELNQISIYGDNDVIKITESDITVNGKEVTTGELKSLMETAIAMRSDDAKIYSMAVALNEHYNDIAYIDFVKRIVSRDNSGRSCDVFKINENIFVNTTDKSLNVSTFYRNVNPIQCRNYINEHMEINCNPLFEDELPDQAGIIDGIDKKKAEYEKYIEELDKKKMELENMMNDAADTTDIDNAIAMIDKERKDVEDAYKQYQKDAEKYINGDDNDKEDSLKDEVPDNGDDDDKSDKDGGDSDDEKGKELDPEKESPEEMEKPIEGDGDEETIDADEFEFPEEFADVADYDADFDIPTEVVSDENGGKSVGYGRFQIVKVAYNKNVKTGSSDGHGEVIILIPSVDANGDIHNDTRKVSFYLDGDRKPIINNEYMPLDMYEEIVDAIENDEMTGNVECVGCVKEEPKDDKIEEPETEVSVDSEDSTGKEDLKDDGFSDIMSDLFGADKNETPDSDKGIQETPAETNKDIQETPAETKEAEEKKSKYPVTVGFYPDEIAPMEMSDFEKAVDGMKIEHNESEANDGEVVLKVKNMAQADALAKFFKKWFSMTDDDLVEYMPEIARCLKDEDNIEVRETNEGVKIVGLKAITDYKPMHIVLPCNESLKKMFGVEAENDVDCFSIITENKNEEMKVYESLYGYALKNNGNVEQDVIDVLEKYGKKYGQISESNCVYKLNVPFNGFLQQKLKSKGFDVNVTNESMSFEIVKDDFKKVKKILESFYGDKAPVEVRDFFQHVNENVTITVKDDSTGKTVTINTDDINGNPNGNPNGNSDETQNPNFDDSFKNVTFDPSESLAFKDDEESADEDDEKDEKKDEKKEEKKESENKEEKDEADKNEESDKDEENKSEKEDTEKEDKKEEAEEGDGSGDEKQSEKPKKKFKFKKTKSNESVDENFSNSLNESTPGIADPNVLDYVRCKGGDKGQIICKQCDGDFIVNVSGHTKVFKPSEVEVITQRPDLVDTPFKYDEATLAGVYESYVKCGMFVNGIQITPNDCSVKLLEYMKASDDAEINIIIEGENAKSMKRYVRILEDLNDVVDLANYAPGVMTHVVEGVEQKTDVLVNVPDYRNYVMTNESSGSVRTLVFDDNNETHLMNISGGNLMMKGTEDLFESKDDKLMDYAISALSE